MWIKSASFNVWVKYFVWNFKGTLWNSIQNILPIHAIHWKISFLYNIEILRAHTRFWNAPQVYQWPGSLHHQAITWHGNCCITRIGCCLPHKWTSSIYVNVMERWGDHNLVKWEHTEFHFTTIQGLIAYNDKDRKKLQSSICLIFN